MMGDLLVGRGVDRFREKPLHLRGGEEALLFPGDCAGPGKRQTDVAATKVVSGEDNVQMGRSPGEELLPQVTPRLGKIVCRGLSDSPAAVFRFAGCCLADPVEIDPRGFDAVHPGHYCPKQRSDDQAVKQPAGADGDQQDRK